MSRPVILTSEADFDGSAWYMLPLFRHWPTEEPCPVVGIFGRSISSLGEELLRIRPDCPVVTLKSTRLLHDWRQFQERILDAYKPMLIHAIGLIATRVIHLHTVIPYLRVTPRPRINVSDTDMPGSGLLGWWTRRATRHANRVLSWSSAETQRYRDQGVVAESINYLPPPAEPPRVELDRALLLQELGLPPGTRLIMTAGRFVAESELKTAIWAFDVVKYTDPRLALVLIGQGPDQERLERFGQAVGYDDYRIRFCKPTVDLAGMFALADLVWVTHRRGGIRETLAAMAAGRPILAVHNAELRDLIRDGETGRFVPAGDRVALAALSSEWLGQPETGIRIGTAAKSFAMTNFSAKSFVERLRSLYYDMLGSFSAD